nr:unnamed protein product [Callosobruchus chinensis]
MHFQDRLLLLAQCTNPHRPFNVKRKPALAKQASAKGGGPGGVTGGQGAVQPVPKLSVQDFVRMDPRFLIEAMEQLRELPLFQHLTKLMKQCMFQLAKENSPRILN